jgi:hypothetical protein
MRGTTKSRKNRAQQVMNEYYNKLGPGPYYYDNSAVAAALREAVEGLNIEIKSFNGGLEKL